jgi:chromosome segregation ATPase
MGDYEDPDYDEIDQLIDTDPIALGYRCRAAEAARDAANERAEWLKDSLTQASERWNREMQELRDNVDTGWHNELNRIQAEVNEVRAARDALLTDLKALANGSDYYSPHLVALRDLLAKHRVVSVPPSGGEG